MFLRQIAIFVACVQLAGNLASADPVTDLMPFVPGDANTLYVFRVKEFVNSPRGVKENWAKKHLEEHLHGEMTVPFWVETLVRSSHIRPGALNGDWTSILLKLPDTVQMEGIAEKEKTEVQEISSHPVVYCSRHNGYFVEFQSPDKNLRILGGIEPATRQDLARWIQESEASSTPKVSDYLLKASRDSGPQIILAVDLAEMLDPVQIRYRLSGLAALEKKSADRLALTLDFQSLRGIRMSVNVTQEISAEIRLDFGRTIGSEGKYVKDLFIDFLNDAGASLDDLQTAHAEVEGKSVVMTMPLSGESLRRILSLISAVSPATAAGRSASENDEKKPTPPSPSEIDVAKTLRYYKAVNHNVDDLEKAYRRIKNYRQTAQWHDNFARRIEELPIDNVDPELLDYGQKMSSLLRALGASLRGMGIQVDALNKQVKYEVTRTPVYRSGFDQWWGGPWSPYGPYNYGRPMQTKVNTNLQEVRAKQAEVVAKTQPEREKIWQMINEERSVTRRKMVSKYGSDFR